MRISDWSSDVCSSDLWRRQGGVEAAELHLDAEVAGHGTLVDDVAEPAAEEQQRGFAFGFDARQVGLDHRAAVGRAVERIAAAQAPGLPRAAGDGGLDDQGFGAGFVEHRVDLPARDAVAPGGRGNRNATLAQRFEITLVGDRKSTRLNSSQ